MGNRRGRRFFGRFERFFQTSISIFRRNLVMRCVSKKPEGCSHASGEVKGAAAGERLSIFETDRLPAAPEPVEAQRAACRFLSGFPSENDGVKLQKNCKKRLTSYAIRIEKLRRQRGWSKKELAHRSGVCERLLRQLRAGAKPTAETNRKLALAFGLEPAEWPGVAVSLRPPIRARRTEQNQSH